MTRIRVNAIRNRLCAADQIVLTSVDEAEKDADGMPEATENPRVSRRLAAILAADIAGYSALMGADDARTVRDLKAHQALILPMIGEHGGRVIDTAGDGILAEFGSIVNAVECAVAVQETMAKRNAEIEEPRRMLYRIGINLGDVIHDDTRVYGDGINIAARLESIAEPGGICISGKVQDEIAGKIGIAFQDLGPQQLKNIAQPVRVYRLDLNNLSRASLPSVKATLSLPDKPSIAVLPFTNLSGDASQDYFSDGITEDIITELSRFSELFVIARNSSFQYKNKSPDIRQVGRELGVRYVLEGSIRRAGDRVRITAQLIDATTGAHRWAERYDRELMDVFAVQDEVARTIVTILAAHVSKAEAERTLLKPPSIWQAHDYFVRASETIAAYMSSLDVGLLYETRRLLKQSLSVDGSYARAYALLAFTHVTAYLQPLDGDFLTPRSLEYAHQFGRKAVQLDPNLPQAYSQLGYVLTFMRQHEAALAAFQRATALNPNFTDWRYVGALAYAGDYARAIEVGRAHMRLDPFYPPVAAGFLGLAYHMHGQYKEALPLIREYASRARQFRSGHVWLAATCVRLGYFDEARVAAADVLRIEPNFTINGTQRTSMAFKIREDAEQFFDSLRGAGLPD